MSRQKIVIIVLSVVGLISTFLPWVKGFWIGTVVGISGLPENMDVIWLVLVAFLIPMIICLINKSEYLKDGILLLSILPPLVVVLISLSFLTLDLNSSKYFFQSNADMLLGVSGASELGLRLGPAPYIVFIVSILIPVFGFALKGRKKILPISEFKGRLTDLDIDFLNKKVHLVCPAVNGVTTYNAFVHGVGGMSIEEAQKIADKVNEINETITFWPKLNMTIIPLTICGIRNDTGNRKIMEKHINDCFDANKEYIKCNKIVFVFEKGDYFDNELALNVLKNRSRVNFTEVYYVPE